MSSKSVNIELRTMLLNFVFFLTLFFYAFTASQPLFYWMAVTGASRNMGAPAYIEMRNRIDDQMRKRGPLVYYSTLVATLALAVFATIQGEPVVRMVSYIASMGLVTDIMLMMKGNIPINAIIQNWTPERYPADWQIYRDRWLKIFGYRQIALCIGFFSLLAGAVFK